jgi:P-type E1-E2 ATPase
VREKSTAQVVYAAVLPLRYEIPGHGLLELEHLLLDVNGTLTSRGQLIDGVAERLAALRGVLVLHLLSADTFGALAEVAERLGVEATVVRDGQAKLSALLELGPARCAAIGNGANDAPMLEAAAVGVAVVGPEGASAAVLRAADVVCASILDALDLLLEERVLVATMRR